VESQTNHSKTAKQPSAHVGSAPSDGILPDDLLEVLWRNRWLVLLTAAVALAAGLVYVTAATPMYTSTSKLYVEQNGPRILAETDGPITPSKNCLYTQATLLASTPILTAAIEKPGIRELKIFQKVSNPIVWLKDKGLHVSVGKTDDIISVSSDSPDPAQAAVLVNAVVEAYRAYHAASRRSTAGGILNILQNEKRQQDTELARKLKAMMDFKSQNIALAFENRNGNVILDKLESLSTETTAAQLQAVEAKFAFENIKAIMADPTLLKSFVDGQRAQSSYISAENEWSRLENELDQLELQLSDQRQKTMPDEAAVTALQQKVRQVENRLQLLYTRFAQTQLAAAQQQYEAAKEKEEQVAAYFEAQREEALKLNRQLAEYRMLESDWEQTKKLCDILDDRIKEIDITEDVGGLNIAVLETAVAADKPSRPAKARCMAIALLSGLVLAGALALVRDWMDQRLHSVEEIAAVLGVPIVGSVPSARRRESAAARGQKVDLDSQSAWAESYRTMRTAVFFGVAKAKGRTILVTSPEAGDGKTTVVSNLAIAMAQAGQKTLVLEADFRRPMQHKVFGMNHHNKGLSSVLAGRESLEGVIKSTRIAGLDLLTCGPDVPNPSETLHSEGFEKLMKLLTKKYDRIIVDSPPVLPVTDAQILASICQITLLVLRAEKSTRRASQQARDALVQVGGHVLGVVVNDAPNNGHYGCYHGNGYYSRANGSSPQKNNAGINHREPAADVKDAGRSERSDNSRSQRIAETTLSEKRTVVTHSRPTTVTVASDGFAHSDNLASENNSCKKVVASKKEPAVAGYDGT
jgi:capsular exopolysaccharide synthesis family protein